MGKGGGSQTVTTRPDPASQRYIGQMRTAAQNAAGVATGTPGSFFTGPQTMSIADQIAPFMNPYMDQVIGGVRGEFDHLRGLAATDAAQQATAQGAFGGSRAAIAQGARLGELDRAQTSQIGGLLQGGYQNALGTGLQYAEHQRQLQERLLQEPLFRQQMGLNFLNAGMGPVGQTQTQTGTAGENPFGYAIGGATAGSAFGPLGAAIGGGLGLLGGLLG